MDFKNKNIFINKIFKIFTLLLTTFFLIYLIIFDIFLALVFVTILISFFSFYFEKGKKLNLLENLEVPFSSKFNEENEINFPYIHYKENKIIYSNKKFNNNINQDIVKPLSNIDFSKKMQVFSFEGEKYNLFINKTTDHFEVIFMPYIDTLENKNNMHSTIVGLIFIDNYEEAMETVEEIRRPLLLALIDRKINTLAQNLQGVVRKFEKDKYILIISYEKLEYLKNNKFEILKQVREIEMGNKMPFTLSIGIGINTETLSQSMEFSRISIDLALGRGGDQAIIKDGENYYFYGGKAKGVENNTRVRSRVKAYVLAELIQESEKVMVMGHKNPDLDSLGACVGICNIAHSLRKECNIILNSNLDNIRALYEKLLEDDTYKNSFLNQEEALKKITKDTLLIVVDCHRLSYVDAPDLLDGTKKLVVFDHHRKSTEFIENLVLTYHEPFASSTCELITEMMQYVKHKIVLSSIEADALFSGISLDTKNFTIKCGIKTFETAAYLRRQGADTIRVRSLMKTDMEAYKQKSIAINNAKIYKENIAITTCPENIKNYHVVVAQTADDLLNIIGIEASFVLYFNEVANKIIISGRSLGEINVHRILEKLGGGGHQSVAGAQFKDETIESVISKLETAIEEYMEEI